MAPLARTMSVESESAARHEVEETLHATLYPGTEIMTDVGHVHFKHVGGHVLIPQPSDDPNDPLNWSPLWKSLSMGGMVISSFTLLFSPLSVAPQVPYYMHDFDSSLPDVINFIGITILVLGFSNIIWVPAARMFGRRPMLTVATLVTIASNIWRAQAKTYNSFLGACILSGIGAGPAETLGPIFLQLGPVVAGITAERYGWRAFWWVSTALSAFSLVYQLFFLPETKWSHRHPQIAHDHIPETSESLPPMDGEKPDTTLTEGSTSTTPSPAEETGAAEIVVKLSGRPGRRQFQLWTGFDKEEMILASIILPFKLWAFPIIQWASFVFSWCASCFLVINITQSQALAGPPWNLSPAEVGYTNFAIFVGALISLVTAGPLSDWVSTRATKKNRGIREPEMRLVALIPYACCTLLGSLIMALGYQNAWRWEAIVIGGYTLIGIQLAAVSAIATTYAVDSYKPVAGEFLVAATVNKNLWAYGLTKFLNIWIEDVGYVGPIMMNAGLCLLWIAFAIPLVFFGKKLRGWTKDSPVHQAK
ncbi:major facilitator superfamily domain-containing protein [Amylocarpus encephaloides]|uniref:Major facilitator superfamily domain-containing protein n=1 Tax=Amylocarpus encephaloides TaxID=45428 RepID=A0A9P7YBF1_9HELO|nr:major facilitator superfamily domain-containing protein [Amylocarpus encephaloides]